MKVIVAGSRTITEYKYIVRAINEACEIHNITGITEVVSGAAPGVDRLGAAFGKANNIPVKEFPAEWDKHGKKAGYLRNEEMAQYADVLVAVWDGMSRGTQHMINIMKKLNKPVYIYYVRTLDSPIPL